MNKPLYEQDFFAWTQAQADALRRRSANELDWDNLFEEVQDMGARDRRELMSRLLQLHLHILKWTHQPERRGSSWARSIRHQQTEIPLLLAQSPSLKAQAEEIDAEAYNAARKAAARDTGLPAPTFPEISALSLEAALDLTVEWEEDGRD